MKKKTIYLPLEIKARELVSQTLLACKVGELGGRVYLGSKSGIFRALLVKPSPDGTFLYKSGMENPEGFKNLKKRVASIAVLDQEMSPARQILNPASRFVGQELDFVDRLYYVGKHLSDALFAELPDLPPDKVKTLGWPRVDLWTKRYSYFWEPGAQELRQRFGEFVLFSSDFGVLSEVDLQKRIQRQTELSRTDPTFQPIGQTRLQQLESHIHEFPRVVDFLRELDEDSVFPAVVVRPHPSENHSIWARALSGLKKTHLVYEGDVSTFLQASVALLHRGCTTALQAELLGKPTGVVVSPGTSRHDSAAISAYSRSVRTVEDALSLVSLDYPVLEPAISPSRVASLDGTASEKIAEDLLALTEKAEIPMPPIHELVLKKRLWAGVVKGAALRYVRREQRKGLAISKTAAVNKMPGGVRVGEIEEILQNLGFDHISARKVPGIKDVVCIEGK